MPTRQELIELLERQALLQREIMEVLQALAPGDTATLQLGADLLDQLTDQMDATLAERGPIPTDGGDADRLGLGANAALTVNGAYAPVEMKPYDETIVSERLLAVADLYYCYQHERLGVFRAVQKLQELFRAGTLRLTSGAGAVGLYRFDVKRTLRYTREQRMQAYRRVFGYTNAAPPPGGRPNAAFHGLLQNFATQLAQLFRDKRVAEVMRGPATTSDASFGSIAATRRAGLDFRANLKQAAYGDVNVLTVELMQLLGQAFEILAAPDIRSQFGSDSAWDTLEEVLKRHLGEEPAASQRSRMGIAGRDIMRWLAQPFVLTTSRPQFEALAMTVAESAEEWLTSAQSVGTLTRSGAAPSASNVVPLRRTGRL